MNTVTLMYFEYSFTLYFILEWVLLLWISVYDEKWSAVKDTLP